MAVRASTCPSPGRSGTGALAAGRPGGRRLVLRRAASCLAQVCQRRKVAYGGTREHLRIVVEIATWKIRSNSMITLFKEDHRNVEKLFKRFEKVGD